MSARFETLVRVKGEMGNGTLGGNVCAPHDLDSHQEGFDVMLKGLSMHLNALTFLRVIYLLSL